MARIIFMGSPEIAVPGLQALKSSGHEILCAVTQPDKPQGRGQKVAAPAIKVAALELKLPILQPDKIRTSEFAAQLSSLKPDFLCVVAYGKILPPEILKIPKYGCINLHFSLLPKYRGASCVAFPLLNGDKDTGVTTILMDAGMDTGPILMQWSENILPEDTTETLSQRLSELGAKQLVKTVEALAAGTIEAIPQREEGACNAPLLKKEMGRVDWSLPAEKIYNLYRGFTPWPGLFSFLDGKRVLLTKVRVGAAPHPCPSPQRGEGDKSVGTIIIGSNGELLVQCGTGVIEILNLKPEGKSNLTPQEFMRGLQMKASLSFA